MSPEIGICRMPGATLLSVPLNHVFGLDLREVARPVRFELTTPCSGGMYSIHLSYGRAVWRSILRIEERAMCRNAANSFDFPILTRLIPSRQRTLYTRHAAAPRKALLG